MALHVARNGLSTLRKGERVRVYAGNIVEDGHWLLDVAPDAFRPLVVHFPAEKSAGGKSAPPKPAASK